MQLESNQEILLPGTRLGAFFPFIAHNCNYTNEKYNTTILKKVMV